MNKSTKKFISRFLQNKKRNRYGLIVPDKNNPLEVPIYRKSRYMADKHNYDSCYEYGIEHMEDWSNEAVKGYFDSKRYEVRSLYDCTGEPVTLWLHWHRNPDGSVSFVHNIGRDI